MYKVTDKQNIFLNGRKVTRAKICRQTENALVFYGFANAKGFNASKSALLKAFLNAEKT